MFELPMRTLLLPFLLVRVAYAQEQSAIGEWRDHFPYSNVTTLAEGGGHIYSASANGAFRYALSSGEIERINKTNLLNDVGIQGLSWNADQQAMLIYYSNGNLDLIQGTSSFNIGDIKRSSIIGNKGVYCAYMQGSLAYLGCGFGIVVADLASREIRDTWYIGPSGAQVLVNGIALTQDSIYAATASGLYTASRTAPNLAFYENWRRRTDMGSSLSAGPFNSVVVIGDKVLVNAPRSTGGDSLLVLGPEDTWSRFAPLFGKVNRSMSVSSDGQSLTIAQSDEVHVYNAALEQTGYLFDFEDQRLAPNQAVTASGGAVWIADRSQGLLRIGGGSTRVAPNGPRSASTWRMASADGNLYVPSGAVTGT